MMRIPERYSVKGLPGILKCFITCHEKGRMGPEAVAGAYDQLRNLSVDSTPVFMQ